jgi:NAD(P)-dependent dehydrogenase (short-subunit alcohol dehydrogenase family)
MTTKQGPPTAVGPADDKRFAGKFILITGAAMGIGAATATRLASEGATVILADRSVEAASTVETTIREAGGHAWIAAVDLADPAQIEAMGRVVAERTSRLHGLVNAAALGKRRGPVAELSVAAWDEEMAVNLRAPALCVKVLLPLLKAGPGHVVNISSEAGFRPRPNRSAYDATKAAIGALSRTLACELAPFGIRVNTVAPGGTVTERHFLGSPDPAARKQELEQQETAGSILRRNGRPEEIAAAIRFLLSDDASYITATTLHVDGGRVAH